jgi:hypothetical protein
MHRMHWQLLQWQWTVDGWTVDVSSRQGRAQGAAEPGSVTNLCNAGPRVAPVLGAPIAAAGAAAFACAGDAAPAHAAQQESRRRRCHRGCTDRHRRCRADERARQAEGDGGGGGTSTPVRVLHPRRRRATACGAACGRGRRAPMARQRRRREQNFLSAPTAASWGPKPFGRRRGRRVGARGVHRPACRRYHRCTIGKLRRCGASWNSQAGSGGAGAHPARVRWSRPRRQGSARDSSRLLQPPHRQVSGALGPGFTDGGDSRGGGKAQFCFSGAGLRRGDY